MFDTIDLSSMAYVVRMKNFDKTDFENIFSKVKTSKETLLGSIEYSIGESEEQISTRCEKIDGLSEAECKIFENHLLSNLGSYLDLDNLDDQSYSFDEDN